MPSTDQEVAELPSKLKVPRKVSGQSEFLWPHLGQVLPRLALVLVPARVQVAGDGGHPEMQLPLLDEDVLQVVAPHGPGFHQHVVHLHGCRERFVRFLRPGRTQIETVNTAGQKTNRREVTNSGAAGTFKMLCDHHLYGGCEHCHHPKETPNQEAPLPTAPNPQPRWPPMELLLLCLCGLTTAHLTLMDPQTATFCV